MDSFVGRLDHEWLSVSKALRLHLRRLWICCLNFGGCCSKDLDLFVYRDWWGGPRRWGRYEARSNDRKARTQNCEVAAGTSRFRFCETIHAA